MRPQTGHLYEFGPFRIDESERLLMRGSQVVPLQPKAVDLLLVLLEANGHVVTKDQLIGRVWADTFVEEINLSRNIFHLRRALGESNGAKFIETIPRRGYRFVAPVIETCQEAASLVSHERTSSRVVVEEEIETHASPFANPGRQTASPKYESATHRSRRLKVAAAVTVAVAAMVIIAGGLWRRNSSSRSQASPSSPFHAMQIRRLTDSGKVRCPALSPDGKMLAYVLNDRNRASIRMRNIETGSEIQITTPTETHLDGLMFARDGSQIFYQAGENGRGVLYRIPVFGGGPTRIAWDVQSHFDISPDGKQLAFLRHYAETAEDVLTVCDVAGGNERKIKSRSGRYYYNTWGTAPAWSPDGKTLVVPAAEHKVEGSSSEEPSQYYVAVSVADGAETTVPSPRWHSVGRVSWLADGSGLIVNVQEKASSPDQIWRLEYPSGAAQRITNDLQNYIWMSLTPDSKLMVVMPDAVYSTISVGPDENPTHLRQLTFEPDTMEGYFGLTWARDGRLVYTATEGGRSTLWVMDEDGGSRQRLTLDKEFNNTYPSVTGEGREVLFISDRAGGQQIWKMNIDGGEPHPLTSERIFWMSTSPDGRWVMFTKGSHPTSDASLWKLPLGVAAAQPIKICDFAATKPVVSPDGNQVAFGFLDKEEKLKSPWKIGVMSMIDGGSLRVFDLPAFRQIVQWTPDGKALSYIKNVINVSNIWIQPLDGSRAKQITDFKTERLVNFAWSKDGKHMAVARGGFTNDAFLISNFR